MKNLLLLMNRRICKRALPFLFLASTACNFLPLFLFSSDPSPHSNQNENKINLPRREETDAVSYRQSADSRLDVTKRARSDHKKYTKLSPSDLIYSRDWWEKPVVIEEYKLIFFSIPKVSCTQWKLLFHRMMGLRYKLQEGEDMVIFHNPKLNKLINLVDYPIDVAEKMMNSPEWTKAIFVREPKERIASAFLDKFCQDGYFFQTYCCNSKILPKQEDREHCGDMMSQKNFTYFLHRTLDCPNPHWDPQWEVVDEKWWSAMSFIGSMKTLSSDVKKLLESLNSTSEDGVIRTAWERFGRDGWGKNNTDGFMQQKSSDTHKTNAAERLCQVYNLENEIFVDDHWRMEWEHPEYMPFENGTICNRH